MYSPESLFGELKRSVRYKKIPEAASQLRFILGQTLQNLGGSLPSRSHDIDFASSTSVRAFGRSKYTRLRKVKKARAWTCHFLTFQGIHTFGILKSTPLASSTIAYLYQDIMSTLTTLIMSIRVAA